MPTRREELIAQIKDEEERIGALQSDIADRHARLKTLREELASLALEPGGFFASTPPAPRVNPSTSNADKLMLFRSLFRGREDVFPLRWENPKTGRYGFSPACANEWNSELCHKGKARGATRRTTCGDCPNKAFIRVTDEQIAGHLKGTHVMGVYPLLTDETCWFLAADFDGESWQEDVAAFGETCTAHGVPVPFATTVLELESVVERIDLNDADENVAICRRGNSRQRIPILDLPLPDPKPEGAEWIDAYRRWARGK